MIHTAFIHDFLNYLPAAEKDKRAIETLGARIVQVDEGFGAAPVADTERDEATESEEA